MSKFYKKKLLISKIYKIIKNNHNSFRTLMYHSISNDNSSVKNNELWILKYSLFKEHINRIKNVRKFYRSETLLSDCPNNGISITFDDGYQDTYELAAPYLIENNVPFTIFVISNFIKNKKKGYMSERMLKELSKNNLVTIGSHSQNHNKLNELNDIELFNDLNNSKIYLEDLLGKSVISLSYPHGKYNNKVKEKVKEVGYKLAFSSKFNNNEKNEDKLCLSRNEIWNSDNIDILNQKLLGNWDWMKYRIT